MKNICFAALLVLLVPLMACDEEDNPTDTTAKITLSFNGLEDLGPDAVYEGWLIVDGNAVTTGTFTVDQSGTLSQTEFEVKESDLTSATNFVLTIEPVPDPDDSPSSVHILAGDFNGSEATLSIDHNLAIGRDLSSASGQVILATPTDGPNTNELSGIWFLDPAGPASTLSLPDLPDGWKYEGWAVIDGVPVTSGTFTQVDAADDADPYSSTQMAPPFPGEDFLLNAPAGVTLPTDLSGSDIVITVEPNPDNSPMPFTIKPLAATMPSPAEDQVLYDMMQSSDSFPTGTASR